MMTMQTDMSHPYMAAISSLQKMIDAELIDVAEDEDGVPRLFLTQLAYDAFFFKDTIHINEDAQWWQKVWLYILVIIRRICSWFHRTERVDNAIRTYIHKLHWFDEPKALAFLDKVRFLINWRRGYVAGSRNFGRDNISPEEEQATLHKLRIPDGEWITFYVVNSDFEPILVGRWVKERFEIKSINNT